MKSVTISRYKIYLDFKLDKFPALNLWPFFAGVIIVFLFSMLSYLGLKLPDFHFKKSLNVNSSRTNNTDSSIVPKLKQKTNNFKLINSANIIPAAFATFDFENATSYIVVDFDKSFGSSSWCERSFGKRFMGSPPFGRGI